MLRTVHLSSYLLCILLVAMAIAWPTPGRAGMTEDLADCTAADRKTSADACTRVMNSGRLPKEQFYIGHFNRGWSYFHDREYDKALADFDSSLGNNADYADSYFSRAVVQHERGDRDLSLADLDRYLDKKGDVVEARLNRARMFRARGDASEAFSEVQRAGALDPGEHKVQILRALALSDLGEQGPARDEAEKAIAGLPDEAGAYYARALVSFREQAIDRAMDDVTKALSLKGTYPTALTLKGRIHEQRGERAGAIASYREALETKSKSIDARVAQAEARERLVALGDREEEAKDAPAKIAASGTAEAEPSSEPAASEGKCRRFIPSVMTTIAVDCER